MENRDLTFSPDDVAEASNMPGAGVGAGIGLAVLSQDDPLLDTLEEVVTSDHAITLCTGESELAEGVMSGKCGVALIDAATVPGPVAQLTARLRQQFPDLVLIVAGGAEHQGQLAAQITSGDVYRFLHKPVSAQRVRLFVEAALRRHDEEHATALRQALEARKDLANDATASTWRGAAGMSSRAKPPIAVIAVIGAALLAGVLWFALRDTPSAPTPVASGSAGSRPATGMGPGATPGASAATTASPLDKATQALLDQAEKAYDRGELVQPAERNAATLFGRVLEKSPGQPQALAGVDKVVNALLGLTEKAILEERLDDAARDIESARVLQPDNVRIAFLSTQLGKERERALLTRARAAAASGDVGKALEVLGSSKDSGARAGLVAEARRTLEAQQVNERVRELLRLAGDKLRRGDLTEPASDNARFYLESARTLAPREPGLARLSDQLTSRALADARTAVGRGDATAANRAIRSASEVGVPSADLDALRAQLAAAQSSAKVAEVGRMASLVSQRISQGRLIEPASDSAKSQFASLLQADPNSPTTSSLRQTLGRAMLTEARRAIGRSDFPAAQRWIGEAESVGLPAAETAAANAEIVTARDALPQRAQVVGAGSLKRIRTVEPSYPREAKANNVTGWVDLEFTVNAEGNVSDIRVTGSQPASVFDIAAVEALSKWRFEPVPRGGVAVDQRARLRMRFQIE